MGAKQIYAEALLEAALERNRLDELDQEARKVMERWEENPELSLFLKMQGIEKREKKEVLEQVVFPWVSAEMQNLMALMVEKGREELLIPVLEQFGEMVMEHKGIRKVQVSSAVPLSPEQKKELEFSLLSAMGCRAVTAEYKEDASLIGGIMVRSEDWAVDLTIRGQLMGMEKYLLARERAEQ